MLIKLDDDTREVLFRLLQRVDLKGAEVPAFSKVIQVLNTEYKESKDDSSKEGN